jgi:hypothetical protein
VAVKIGQMGPIVDQGEGKEESRVIYLARKL